MDEMVLTPVVGPAPTAPRAPQEIPAPLLRIAEMGDDEAPRWQEQALCAQTDPESFFPEKGGSTREAKRICAACDVRQECLEYALARDERFGIWGGMSERERRRLRRQAV
jgi:WhiB family redox-sensing transcriptional regulator